MQNESVFCNGWHWIHGPVGLTWVTMLGRSSTLDLPRLEIVCLLNLSLPCIQMYDSGTWEGTSLSCRFEIVTSSLAIGWPACYTDNSYSYSDTLRRKSFLGEDTLQSVCLKHVSHESLTLLSVTLLLPLLLPSFTPFPLPPSSLPPFVHPSLPPFFPLPTPSLPPFVHPSLPPFFPLPSH